MVIDVSELQQEIGKELKVDVRYEPETDDFEKGVRVLEPVLVHLQLTGGAGRIWLDGELEARVEFTCDRCLKKYEAELETHYFEEYRRRGGRADAEEEDGEFRTVYYEGTNIDVEAGIREALLLLMPTKRLCSENCKGLCPTCGHDLNKGPCECEDDDIDPRLEILKQFEFDDDEGSVS